MSDEKTRTVLITGGSRGIGRATSVLCGAKSWSVAINFEGKWFVPYVFGAVQNRG